MKLRIKILWDTTIQCNHVVKARKHDIVAVEKDSTKAIIIVDIASPWDQEGKKKYQDLKREIGKL